jgi:hypothetical protein
LKLNRMERPASSRRELRVVAVVVPMILTLGFFLTLALTETLQWSIQLWRGSCMVAGITGPLLSFLRMPVGRTVERQRPSHAS